MKKIFTSFFLCCLGVLNLQAQCEFSENFDSYTTNVLPTNWTLRNTTTGNSYTYTQTSATAPSPSRFLRMYSGSTSLTGELILITPIIANASDGLHRIKFFMQGSAGNPSSLIVGTMDSDSATGVFTPVTTISSYPDTSWQEFYVTIPAGTDQYIAFKHSLTTTADQLNLDNICVQLIPNCLEVNQIVASNALNNSIDLTWNQSGSAENAWQYMVQPSGTGLPTTDGIDYSQTSATPSLTVNNLLSNTLYEVYVRAKCSASSFGEWILAAASIRTQCDNVTQNYCEDFVSTLNNTVPFCWTSNAGGGTGGVAKVVYQFSGYNKNMFDLYYPISTTGIVSMTSPNIAYATDGLHRLRFKAGATDTTTGLLEVGTIDNQGNFVQINALTLSTNRNAEYLVTLPNNGNAHYSFRHNGSTGKHIYINQVCIEDSPACFEVANIAFTAITSTTVTATWTASTSAETSWEYIVQLSTLPAPTSTTSGTTSASLSNLVSELIPNSSYSIYVRANCATNGFGAWTGPANFTTSCNAFTVPFNEGFQGANVSTEVIKPCWSAYNTGNGDLKTFGISFGVSPSEGALQLRFFFQNTTPVESLVLVSPEFSDLDANKRIRFKMNKRSGFEANMNILVGTVASPTDMASFELIDGAMLNQTSIIAGPWTEFTIDLTNYNTALGHKYIAFKPQHSGTGASQNVFMDEFVYEQNPDIPVLNDEAADAYTVEVSTGYTCNNQIIGNFVGATHSAEYPCTQPAYVNHKDLWYTFTPETSGTYSITGTPTNGQIGLMNMFIFTGTPGDLTAISSGCSTNFNSKYFNAEETYYISVASAIETTQFRLCVYKFPDLPANDEPTGAISFEESPDFNCVNGIEGTTGSATHSAESACSVQTVDVWYTFTPLETKEYTLRRNMLNGSAPTGVTLYSGTPGDLTEMGQTCGGALLLVNLEAGITYYVSVSSSGSSLPIYYTLCAYPSPPPPSNDNCDAPISLTVGQTFAENAIVGNNTSATVNATNSNYPSCGTLEFSQYGRDVWFTAVVPESGSLIIETRAQAGSLLTDTIIETYTGSCGTSTLIPFYYQLPPPNTSSAYCSEQYVIGGNPFAGMLFTNKQPGTLIFIRAWGWSRQFGDFQISAYDPSPTCSKPTDVVVTPSLTSAEVSWTASATAPNGYYYMVQTVGMGYPNAATSGIFTNQTTELITDLVPQYDYELYVRSNCDTNTSAWEGPIPFTTSSLSTGQFDTNKFKIFPNPVNSVLNIKNDFVIKQVDIYNMNGQVILSKTTDATEMEINVSHLSKGIYVLKATTDTAQQTFKIVVN